MQNLDNDSLVNITSFLSLKDFCLFQLTNKSIHKLLRKDPCAWFAQYSNQTGRTRMVKNVNYRRRVAYRIKKGMEKHLSERNQQMLQRIVTSSERDIASANYEIEYTRDRKRKAYLVFEHLDAMLVVKEKKLLTHIERKEKAQLQIWNRPEPPQQFIDRLFASFPTKPKKVQLPPSIAPNIH